MQAGQGFGTHGHRDMEIISYVIDGALAHKDSMGNGAAIVPGEIQRMSAGTGVTHSEYNHDRTGVTHFLQIWIIPAEQGLPPSYEQRAFADSEKRGRLRLVGSPDGRDASVTIHQDVQMYAGLFDADEHAELALADGRLAYVHVVQGSALINGQRLAAGDAAKLTAESTISLGDGDRAEVLVFDRPALPVLPAPASRAHALALHRDGDHRRAAPRRRAAPSRLRPGRAPGRAAAGRQRSGGAGALREAGRGLGLRRDQPQRRLPVRAGADRAASAPA